MEGGGRILIFVEVYVPAYDRSYEMQAEERIPVGRLLCEMAALISQKEKSSFSGDTEELCLCSMEYGQLLSPEHSLQEYGIGNGSRLLIV